MTIYNARQLDTSPISCVVKGMIPEVGSGFVHGVSGTGKSYTFLTRLALDVANGVPFFGHDTIQGNVIIALGEGVQDAGNRIKAQLIQHAEEDDAAVAAVLAAQGPAAAAAFRASLPPYTDDHLIIEDAAFPIPFEPGNKVSDGMQRFLASVEGTQPVLMIYDAVDDFAGTSATTSHGAASRYVMGIKHLVKELNCFILGIGHDTGNGDKMIGAQRFFSAADIMMAVKGVPGEEGVSAVTSEKAKYGTRFTPWSYRAVKKSWDEPVLDDDDLPTGETELVETHVVTLAEDPAGSSFVIPEANRVVPDSTVPAKRKRNGIKIGTGLSLEARQARVEKLLAKPCHECGAPATRGCNPVPGSVHSTVAPNVQVHVSRAAQPEMAEVAS